MGKLAIKLAVLIIRLFFELTKRLTFTLVTSLEQK